MSKCEVLKAPHVEKNKTKLCQLVVIRKDGISQRNDDHNSQHDHKNPSGRDEMCKNKKLWKNTKYISDDLLCHAQLNPLVKVFKVRY